jgi:hypothetical protein
MAGLMTFTGAGASLDVPLPASRTPVKRFPFEATLYWARVSGLFSAGLGLRSGRWDTVWRQVEGGRRQQE